MKKGFVVGVLLGLVGACFGLGCGQARAAAPIPTTWASYTAAAWCNYVYKTAGVEHGLICSTADLSTSQAWSNVDSTAIGATAQSSWDGLGNSNAIVAQSGHTSSAAKLCLDYTNSDTGTGVYSDWYLPSRYELNLMYQQAFAITKALSSGFASDVYWSSTEGDASNAWDQNFSDGSQNGYDKFTTYYVRAVRAF